MGRKQMTAPMMISQCCKTPLTLHVVTLLQAWLKTEQTTIYIQTVIVWFCKWNESYNCTFDLDCIRILICDREFFLKWKIINYIYLMVEYFDEMLGIICRKCREYTA